MTVREFRRRLKALHSQGWVWRRIGALFGHTKGWAHKIAHYPIPVSDKILQMADEILPASLWETRQQLDDRVFSILWFRSTLVGDIAWITGREIARQCGTNDRTIRGSIKRLRDKGHNISASLAPPRGYRLEEK